MHTAHHFKLQWHHVWQNVTCQCLDYMIIIILWCIFTFSNHTHYPRVVLKPWSKEHKSYRYKVSQSQQPFIFQGGGTYDLQSDMDYLNSLFFQVSNKTTFKNSYELNSKTPTQARPQQQKCKKYEMQHLSKLRQFFSYNSQAYLFYLLQASEIFTQIGDFSGWTVAVDFFLLLQRFLQMDLVSSIWPVTTWMGDRLGTSRRVWSMGLASSHISILKSIDQAVRQLWKKVRTCARDRHLAFPGGHPYT